MKTSMQEKESRQAGAAITRPGLCRARCAEHTRLSGIKAGLRMRHRRLCCLVLFGAEAGVLQNRCVALPPSLRLALQGRRLAPSTINLRLAAVRRLAYEAADTGLLSPELAAGIRRVKGQADRRASGELVDCGTEPDLTPGSESPEAEGPARQGHFGVAVWVWIRPGRSSSSPPG